MAEDWDLLAIVRSCQSAPNTATTETPPTTTNSISPQDTTSYLATVKEENDQFSFPNLVQPITNGFQEINQLLMPFYPTTTTPIGHVINPNSPFYDFAGSIGQQERQQRHQHPVLAPTTHASIWPHVVPESSTFGFNRFHGQQQQQPRQHVQQPQHPQQNQQQQQQVQKLEFPLLQSSSPIALPNTQPQTPRSRKRKSQLKRTVCHVTADNLSADLWAWRKYGQKPIKGSPYPRNYYRCSSSKGCSARKQIERSYEEANMFIVTYTGDHKHPKPTHRNSLAGSTRSKPSPSTQAKNVTSSSPVHSPTTPFTDPPENDAAVEEPTNAGETETDVASEDDADILLPNTAAATSEDTFLGLGHFVGDNGGGGGSPGA